MIVPRDSVIVTGMIGRPGWRLVGASTHPLTVWCLQAP